MDIIWKLYSCWSQWWKFQLHISFLARDTYYNSYPMYRRDPHIILFYILLFYSQIRFLTSHYSHYFPWLGYVRSIEGLARDSVDVELTIYYRIYTGRKELENEDDRAEKADWRQSQTLLTRCSCRVDVDDAIITISGHCTKLNYSIQPTWGSRDLIYRPIILA